MVTNTPSEEPNNTKIEIPKDAIEIREVQYSWLWRPIWGIVLLVIAFSFGMIPEPISLSFLIVLILVPYFFYARRTRYYLTEEILLYQPGYIWRKSGPYELPYSRIQKTSLSFGLFGRALGYQHVRLTFDNGATATLKFIPIDIDLIKYLDERLTPAEDSPQTESANDVTEDQGQKDQTDLIAEDSPETESTNEVVKNQDQEDKSGA